MVQRFPLKSVRLLESPFFRAAEANRAYLLAHDPDRLLAPFLQDAGLEPKAPAYGNWESNGLDGHTAGHYLSALATMIAAGHDTDDGELARRLDRMLDELERCRAARGDGYLGGVPGGDALWTQVRRGQIEAHGFALNDKWVPWYNVHKTFAGLRDAWVYAERDQARPLLIGLADWCVGLIADLDDDQMQDMLRSEHGGMNEALAEVYALTDEVKYLRAAERFNHDAVLGPLMRQRDELTGMHANTQIPKVVGLERIAQFTGDREAHRGAEFFWKTVADERSVAFGGNSVAEHFHDKQDFSRVLEEREGPETCNTYNMLRLSALLFESEPKAAYADFYERALYNHILASIHPTDPGYVYFTPLRPQHYRVYSQPEQAFWCCVGSGMENPGRYGEFIYARSGDPAADGPDAAVYVNLFVASRLDVAEGFAIEQRTAFPDEPRTRLTLRLDRPRAFALRVRHPAWVAAEEFAVKVNGGAVATSSTPSSYAEVRRAWRDGDTVEVQLPMRTVAEPLPDGSGWVALMHGPIVLASPSGTDRVDGLRADDSRMGHIAHGPLVPRDRVPVLLTTADELPKHVQPDPDAGPLAFRLTQVVWPPEAPPEDNAPEVNGLPLRPFFRLHDERYQMVWRLTTAEEVEARRQQLAAEEKQRAAREAATLDRVAIGEQQPEVEHGFRGEETETGTHEGRRWRHGRMIEYTLDPRGAADVALEVTYWGGDDGRAFDILVNGQRIASEQLRAEQPGSFITRTYDVPPQLVRGSDGGKLTVRFVATQHLAGGVYDIRLTRME